MKASGFEDISTFRAAMDAGYSDKASFEEFERSGCASKEEFEKMKASEFEDISTFRAAMDAGYSDKASFEEFERSGCASKAEYRAMKATGFDDRAAYLEATVELCLRSAHDYLQFKRMGFDGIGEKKLYFECKALQLDSKADLLFYKGNNFKTKDEFVKFRKMGFSNKSEFDTCRALGFSMKQAFDDFQEQKFISKDKYDECRQMGFTKKIEYEECLRLGFTTKVTYDAWQKDRLFLSDGCNVDKMTFHHMARSRDGSVSRKELSDVTQCDPLQFSHAQSIADACTEGHLCLIDAKLFIHLASKGKPLPSLEQIETNYPSYIIRDVKDTDIFHMDLHAGGFIRVDPDDTTDTIIIVLSCHWQAKFHPDPDQIWLPKVAALLQKYCEFWGNPEILRGRWSKKRIAVWCDYSCLRDSGEDVSFFEGQLRSAALIIGHRMSQVWRVAESPSDIVEGRESYAHQGWAILETYLSSLVKALVLDLNCSDALVIESAAPVGEGDGNNAIIFHEYTNLGLDFSGTLLEGCYVSNPRVYAPSDFEMSTKKIARNQSIDHDSLVSMYRVTSLQILRFCKELHWHARDWGAANMKQLDKLMPLAINLTTLDLSMNFSYEEAIMDLPEICCPTLERLSFAFCSELSQEPVLAFVRRGCTRLQHLDLQGCECLADEGIARIATFCTKLSSLNLTGCRQITDVAVCSIAKSGKELQLLVLSECVAITDASIVVLAQSCALLQDLDLEDVCISDTSILALAGGCKLLRSLNIMNGGGDITEEALRVLPDTCSIFGP